METIRKSTLKMTHTLILSQIYINAIFKSSLMDICIFSYADDISVLLDGDNWEQTKAKTENDVSI